MQVIKHGNLIDDQWQTIAPDGNIDEASSSDVIVPAALWLEHRTALIGRDGRLGLGLCGDDNLEEFRADLKHFDLIALEFPTFRDGRAYSMSRRLRRDYGYQGELRAVGDVLRDQLAYMQRVGFDSFVVHSRQSAEDGLKAFEEITVKYQTSSDESLPLYRRRA